MSLRKKGIYHRLQWLYNLKANIFTLCLSLSLCRSFLVFLLRELRNCKTLALLKSSTAKLKIKKKRNNIRKRSWHKHFCLKRYKQRWECKMLESWNENKIIQKKKRIKVCYNYVGHNGGNDKVLKKEKVTDQRM